MKIKYNLFKNTRYAIEGIICALKYETSFRIEIMLLFVNIFFLFILKLDLFYNFIIIFSSLLILIVELINSALENISDFCTTKKNYLIKRVKDLGSAAVFVSFIFHIFCWFLAISSIF
jgi:diacylglycerol kinase (ATP)